jgi:hypothetical protein
MLFQERFSCHTTPLRAIYFQDQGSIKGLSIKTRSRLIKTLSRLYQCFIKVYVRVNVRVYQTWQRLAGFIEVSAGHPNASAKAGVWESRRREERRGHRRGEERCVDTQRTEESGHTQRRGETLTHRHTSVGGHVVKTTRET